VQPEMPPMQSDAFEHGAPRVQVGVVLVLVHPTAANWTAMQRRPTANEK
jgi:hypothetical protein